MSKPWQGDAVSLVEAFRSGERAPSEELEATIEAIEASGLRAFPFLDLGWARSAAADADVSQPFGGVPIGIKELEPVEGWPANEASLVFDGRLAEHTATHVERILGAGAVPVGQTAASEFGGLNVSVTKLHGVTHNPWQHGKTAGGSSGGSAAGSRRRTRADRNRWRWRRFDPNPGRFQRTGGHEGHGRPDPPRPEDDDRTADRRGRLPGPVRARRRPLVRRGERVRHP